MDVEMPEMDGFQTVFQIKQKKRLSLIPIIFLTGRHDSLAEIKALDAGANDFITKPVEKAVLLHRINLHLRVSKYQRHLEDTVNDLESNLLTSFAELIEYRDTDIGRHSKRKGNYVNILGQALIENGLFQGEFNEYDLEMTTRAAPLHDIGKICVSDLILLKPAQLTDDEWAIMKQHPRIGAEILEGMYQRTPTQTYLRYGKIIAESHHERFDGAGYPSGLKGEEIPVCSRIMAVIDVYDALVSKRVYRPAMSHSKAFDIIIEGRGSLFDPQVVDVFEAIFAKFNRVN
jgi:putative two-component system response regulator